MGAFSLIVVINLLNRCLTMIEMSRTSVIFCYMLIACFLSCSPHSGYQKPPMLGDYEAQRHWMELAVNVPISSIYTNGASNNLSYWGVDYPPLTVYHSAFLGYIASVINGNWTKIDASHGIESYNHKFFMRASVVCSSLLTFVPASVALSSKLREVLLVFTLLMLNPGLLLIDNAHFQYNAVSLGLLVLSVSFLITNKVVYASFSFCVAINYKQMELYHSLPVFFFLLSYCCEKSIGNFFRRFVRISTTVMVCFTLLWLPYLSSVESVLQVVKRLFPLNRGLFEDKVANLWCTLNNIVKLRLIFDQGQLAILSAVLTIIASLPSCILVFTRRSLQSLLISLTSTSLAFFLFSYQVHEKSILLFTVPLAMLAEFLDPHLVVHYLSVSSLSMCHLYLKDEFLLIGFSYTLLFSVLLHFSCSDKRQRPAIDYKSPIIVSWSGFIAIILLMAYGPIPKKLPDIYVVLLCAYSFVHFFLFYLATLVMVFEQFMKTPGTQKMKFKSS